MTDAVEPPTVDSDDILHLDDDRFHGSSVCLVTGAASGIGRATALVAAANGLSVLATDVDGSGLEETVSRGEDLELDGTIEPHTADLLDDDDLDSLIRATKAQGTPRFVANIAGLQHVESLEEFPMEQYDRMQDVMVRAPVYLARGLFPTIREAGGGSIGNMASVHGHYVTKDKVAYNVAKFAIRGLTQSLAAEGGGTVRSFSISTGYVATPLVTDQLGDTARQRDLTVDEVVEDVMLGQSRVKEMMDPVDVANLFLFGFSRHARHLNGGDLLFDGGMVNTY